MKIRLTKPIFRVIFVLRKFARPEKAVSTIHVVLLGAYQGLVETLRHELSNSTPKVELHETPAIGLATDMCRAYPEQPVLLLVDPHNLWTSLIVLGLWLERVRREGLARVYILGKSEEWPSLDHAALCQGIVPHARSLRLIQEFVTAATAAKEDAHVADA